MSFFRKFCVHTIWMIPSWIIKWKKDLFSLKQITAYFWEWRHSNYCIQCLILALPSRGRWALMLVKESNRTLLTLSWRRPLSYRNQFIDLLRKLIDWFVYDNGHRHERVNYFLKSSIFDVWLSSDCVTHSNFCKYVICSKIFITFVIWCKK